MYNYSREILTYLLAMIFLIYAPTALLAQENEEEKVFTIVEKAAEPVGGMDAFYDHVKRTFKYPIEAKRLGIQGKVFATFIVEKDGSISNIEIVRGIGGGCDEEMVRILETSPKWSPATQKGIPVRQKMSFPLNFKLSGDGENMIYTDPEVPAEPVYGMKDFAAYVKKELKYPKKAKKKKIEGKVLISFVVNKNGFLSNFWIEESLDPECDQEALRLIREYTTRWIPAKYKGEAVRQKMILPIFFKL